MRMSRTTWMACVLVSGCAVSHDVGETGASLSSSMMLTSECKEEVADAFDGLPLHFDCTGLYSDTANKTLADNVHEFAPAFPLWSDGSVKTRWLYLPEGTQIDASDARNWAFPVGARFWKEFRNPKGDKRIETRIFTKAENGQWSRATYHWDDTEENATRVNDDGEDITVDGKSYRLPSRTQCDECHKGRRDRVLGFDQVSLGQSNQAAGSGILGLGDLLSQNLLSNFDGPVPMQIGAAPGNAEAKALGWMHTNCGVTCHNDNSNSKAYSNGMRLMLDPKELDGRPTSEFDAVTTTVDQAVSSLQWRDRKRITPGDPDSSWLYTLITQRGDPKQQMPPLATNEVDTNNANIVKAWIVSLGADDQAATSP